MRYMALIYGNEAASAAMNEAERQAEMVAYNALGELAGSRGAMLSGEALVPTSSATTVKVRDGKLLVTDGPFAETKEQLSGFYLLKCDNLDQAIELASQIPGAQTGLVELRPVVEWD